MKTYILLFATLSLYISTLLSSSTSLPSKEKNEVITTIKQSEKANFIATFLRTPFALVGATLTLFSIAIVGFLEFWGYLFSGFEYRFPITHEIIDIGWKGIVRNWWYQPAVGWHLVCCAAFWIILFTRKRK